ncbi:hypothetical protein CMV_028268 [Castanea mollissima]|uniref:Uncharacterized protein n=1 Tax=Castanea mollissima TaxID=60419 RepID=A0A8J4Q8Q3_9ROSI|nr:hypothetical protein CMV_028268 [Castanea mollissima]
MMENPEKLRRKPSFHGGGSTVRSTIHPERKEGVKDGQKGMENPYESDLEFESSFAWLKRQHYQVVLQCSNFHFVFYSTSYQSMVVPM